jgi:hypothetical protein
VSVRRDEGVARLEPCVRCVSSPPCVSMLQLLFLGHVGVKIGGSENWHVMIDNHIVFCFIISLPHLGTLKMAAT